MYTVSKGPSKLVAKTRTGLSQNYDKIETLRKCNNSDQFGNSTGTSNGNNKEIDISVAKPVFQQYRRSHSNRNNHNHKDLRIGYQDQDPPTPQYEELIKYIRDSWNVISGEVASEQSDSTVSISSDSNNNEVTSSTSSSSITSTSSSTSSASAAKIQKTSHNSTKKVVYHNDPPSPALQDFGAFDLESWWGRRLFNNITKSL